MAGKKLDVPQRDREHIVCAYRDGHTLTAIMRDTGYAVYTIKRILVEEGVEGVKKSNVKIYRVCDCGNRNPEEAKYCFICGKQLRTAEEKVIDGLLSARASATTYAPDGVKKEIDAQIMAAVNLLKLKCGVK